jgi:hypothetical protein
MLSTLRGMYGEVLSSGAILSAFSEGARKTIGPIAHIACAGWLERIIERKTSGRSFAGD